MEKTWLRYAAIIICLFNFAGMLYADNSIQEVTQQTLDGEIVTSKTLKGVPIVINIGSHW